MKKVLEFINIIWEVEKGVKMEIGGSLSKLIFKIRSLLIMFYFVNW